MLNMNIGGNIVGIIQIKTTGGKNALGEAENVWADYILVPGWLGLQSGGSNRNTFNAKIEESSHVFLCDYVEGIYALRNQDTRMKIKDDMYDVLLIDNPDEMNEQLEIDLDKVGGQNG